MTYEQFKNLPDGQMLYDSKTSRLKRQHCFITVQQHSKVYQGVKVYGREFGSEIIPYADHLLYDVWEEGGNESSLPFY